MTSSKSRVLTLAVWLARLILAGVFIYAGYIKVREPWQLFAAAIAGYELVPMSVGVIIAKTFPWVEIAMGVALLIGWRLLPIASILTALVMLFFNVMLWRAYLQGKQIECGCFGPGEALNWVTLLRDGSLLAIAVLVVWHALASSRDRSLG
ncbi:MAG: DoxX family membrane protein [Acidobacteriota bacterium]|nr:DoxX family membrane protein [Acidobacteriota bacterium]